MALKAVYPTDRRNLALIEDRSRPGCCILTALTLVFGLALILAFALLMDGFDGAQLAEAPTPVPSPTVQHYLPAVGVAFPDAPDLQLAFLNGGNLWLAHILPGLDLREEWLKKNLPDPVQITRDWTAVSFAWSPDGQRIAAFDGRSVRFVHVDSKVETPSAIDLKLPQPQTSTLPSLMWTPDQRHVVLWNIPNPWKDAPVGWFIIPVDRPDEPMPVPGRVVKMLALSNGSLIGIVAKPCNQEPCPLELHRYDPDLEEFTSFSLDSSSLQGGVGILSTAASALLNDAVDVECPYYYDSPASLTLSPRPLPGSLEGKDMPNDFILAPDGSSILVTRGVACSEQISAEWIKSCWPGGGPNPYKMSFWNGHSGEKTQLTVPGVFIDWSPDSRWVAFQSCLAATPSRDLDQTGAAPPWIYILDSDRLKAEEQEGSVLPIAEGCMPAWRPMP